MPPNPSLFLQFIYKRKESIMTKKERKQFMANKANIANKKPAISIFSFISAYKLIV